MRSQHTPLCEESRYMKKVLTWKTMYNLQHKSLYRSLHMQHLTKIDERRGVHYLEAGCYVSLWIGTSFSALQHKAPRAGHYFVCTVDCLQAKLVSAKSSELLPLNGYLAGTVGRCTRKQHFDLAAIYPQTSRNSLLVNPVSWALPFLLTIKIACIAPWVS